MGNRWHRKRRTELRPAHEKERRGARYDTPRLLPSLELPNALPTVACPLLRATTELLPVCSPILTVGFQVLLILMYIPAIGSNIPTISSPVLAISA
jgi:hypothetical protein